MDKFVKRIQSRLTYSGIKITKAECREAFQRGIPEQDWTNPSDEQIAEIVNWVIRGQESQIEHDISVDLAPIPQPETFEITPQDNPDVWAHLSVPGPESEEGDHAIATPEAQELEELSLAKTESDLAVQQADESLALKADFNQSLSQAVRQLGETNNAETMQLLGSLYTELSSDISDAEEMVAALVSGYLNKRQSILSSAMGTISSIRSAQSESFQSGLDSDFFDQKRLKKQNFLTAVDAMFN